MIIFNRSQPNLEKDNPFESDDQFLYSQKVLKDYHGDDALVHLGVGTADNDPMSLEVILDHNEDFDDWLIKNNRSAQLADDYTIGLEWAEDGVKFVNSLCVVISKPVA